MPVRRDRRRDPRRPARDRRFRLARLPARGRSRPALRLPGARPLRPGARAALQSGQAAARPVRQGGRRATSAGTSRCSATSSADPRRPQHRRRRGQHAEGRGDQPVLRLGQRPAAAHPVPRDRDLRGARARLDPAPPGRSRGTCAAPTPAWPTRRSSSTCSRLGRDRGRADAGAPVRLRAARWSRRGLTNYWGYNTIGFFAPHDALLPRPASAASRSASSRRWCKALHAAGIEVILDVVYNHTAEGDRPGPTLSFRGIDNAAYYRLDDDDPCALHRLHRLRQHASNVAAPALAAADHGLAAVLGHRDARRRVPVRPGVGAWPASCTTSTGCPRSSTWSSRTRWSRRSS